MMKKTSVFVLCAMCAGMLFLSARAFAEEVKVDLKTLLPKDSALVIGVDAPGLMSSDVYALLKDRVFSGVKEDYSIVESFLNKSGLIVKRTKDKEVVFSGPEIILVKRSLTVAKDDTSALLLGVFKADQMETIAKAAGVALKAQIPSTEEDGKKIFVFKGVFQKDEAIYAAQLSANIIAMSPNKQDVLDYIKRLATPPEAANAVPDEMMKVIETARKDATVWAAAYIDEKRRAEFKGSKDQNETMLQFVKSVSLKIQMLKPDKDTKKGGADVTIECEYADLNAGAFLVVALNKLRERVILAFEDPVIKQVFSEPSTTITQNAGDQKVKVVMKASHEGCQHLIDQFGNLLGVEKPKPPEAKGTGTPAPPAGPGTPPTTAPAPGTAPAGQKPPA